MSSEDRRKEKRLTVQGKVLFRLRGPLVREFEGELRDVSQRGFRASHQILTLGIGERVEFAHSRKHGVAIVMWNRVAAQGVESGFLLEEAARGA